MAGYSGTPLSKKLGLKPGSKIVLAGAPKDYLDLIALAPPRCEHWRSNLRSHGPRSRFFHKAHGSPDFLDKLPFKVEA